MKTLKDLTKEQLINDLVLLRQRMSELERIETDKKKYEEELNRTKAMFEGLFEFAPDAILVVNSEGHFIRINKQTERLFGYSRNELLNTPVENLLPERFREMHEEHRRKYLTEPHVRPMGKELELYGRRKDSSEFHVDISLGPLQIGQDFFVLAVVRDFTERKLIEEELRRSRNELELRVDKRTAELSATVNKLEQLNQELQDFAFIASHDLQEPLRKIQAFGAMLIRKHKESLNPEGQDYMERITMAANRMSELLRALLGYSRTGTSRLNYQPVSLTEVVKDAANDLEIMIKKVTGSVEISELPTVDGDSALLRQLFQNIIGNSIKYRKETEPPIVKIYGRITDSVCHVFIEDNGIGFDECYSQKIFKPFERLHGRNAPYSGTGMGLAICKKIVIRHGGQIAVNSIQEQGTTFIVTLPIKQKAVA